MLGMLVFLAYTYLLAAVPFGVVVTTIWGGDVDVRAAGSGNIGATNVGRVYGARMAATVLALDASKGALPVLAGLALWPDAGMAWGGAVALTAWFGHCFPIYLEFRGGKGVATGAGALLALAPLPTLLAGGLWGALLAGTGRASVAALGATAGMVGLAWVLVPEVLPVAALLALGIGYTHLANVGRLVRGEEDAVVRPVRFGRAADPRGTAEQALREGPGGAASPSLWKEQTFDPLDDVDEIPVSEGKP